MAVSPDDSAATLKFEKMQKLVLGGEISFQLVKKDDTNEDPLIVRELQKAIRGTEAPGAAPRFRKSARATKASLGRPGPSKRPASTATAAHMCSRRREAGSSTTHADRLRGRHRRAEKAYVACSM